MEENEYEDEINYDEDMYDVEDIDRKASGPMTVSDEYELLKSNDFNAKRNTQIKEFQEFSSLSVDEATIILINYNWNIEKLTAEWYDKTDSIKRKSGIELDKKAREKIKQFENTNYCLVCYDEFSSTVPKIGLKCGHFLCKSCFYDYIVNKLENDPLLIISTPCPQAGCNLIVGESIIQKLLAKDPEIQKKYNKFLLKNYTDSNSDIKTCPNPKCDIVVRVPGHGMKEIKCICGTVFCFKCLKESHRPVDCEMNDTWEKMNSTSDCDSLWLKTYTKQCPKCKKHIEKNQ